MQVQALVMPVPRRCEGAAALEDLETDAACCEGLPDGEACRAGADNQDLVQPKMNSAQTRAIAGSCGAHSGNGMSGTS
jgi:hypothetical protein